MDAEDLESKQLERRLGGGIGRHEECAARGILPSLARLARCERRLAVGDEPRLG